MITISNTLKIPKYQPTHLFAPNYHHYYLFSLLLTLIVCNAAKLSRLQILVNIFHKNKLTNAKQHIIGLYPQLQQKCAPTFCPEISDFKWVELVICS